MQGSVVALVPAAGRGERFGGDVPKALVELAGEPLVVHAVRALLSSRAVTQVVVAAPPELLADVQRLLPGAVVVAGGATRVASVAAALAAADADADVVLVHDAARPLAPPDLVDRVAGVVLDGAPAVIPVVPVVDTVKRVDAAGRVLDTVDRADLRAVQTPQGFRRDVLVAAHARAAADGEDATDDAGLVERIGIEVVTVPGDERAFKVTTPHDLARAALVVGA
ncbi:MAG TPA: 2-C-methyl-D-erythritol 4-phosphate cytidylyltransferase [Mycobacteriales bacterium]|nr:2-C-methyl-D-erythritol 4-phosphate cytidylyltransferase [Mycobacteriales bacterium]